MRKYIAVALIAAVLTAGQAVAAASDAGGSDRQPPCFGDSDNQTGEHETDRVLYCAVSVALVGLITWGAIDLSHHHHEHPASP
jgi:hypothetical protein